MGGYNIVAGFLIFFFIFIYFVWFSTSLRIENDKEKNIKSVNAISIGSVFFLKIPKINKKIISPSGLAISGNILLI